jgi:cyclophilin family peptidyl-prolyl cis-trans isomerase
MSKRMVRLAGSTLFFAAGIVAYFAFQARNANNGSVSVVSPPTQANDGVDLERLLEVDEQGLSRVSAVIQTTRGKIRLKFYSKDAPKTVRREIELIRLGFYNGLIFHRVVPGFVIQGGDPTGTGKGGSGVMQQAEFNQRKHVPGTVAMARADQDVHSADSQFYISLGTHPTLDQQYTVFGQVIEGQEVANQIQVGDRMSAITLE